MKKFFKLLLIVFLILIGINHHSYSESFISVNTNIIDISATDAYKLINKKQILADFVIIDVRTPKEFKSGHIKGAILLDFNGNDFFDALKKLNRSKKYLVYCRSGNRSNYVATSLDNLGFKFIYHMNFGLNEWISSNLPMDK